MGCESGGSLKVPELPPKPPNTQNREEKLASLLATVSNQTVGNVQQKVVFASTDLPLLNPSSEVQTLHLHTHLLFMGRHNSHWHHPPLTPTVPRTGPC